MLLLALLIAVVSARPLQALPPHHADGGKPLASLPSCNGCFTGFNGVDYACCNDMTFNNGVCSCSGGTPCTQCAPSPKDKQKVFPLLPSCGGCYSGVNGVDYTCSDCSISISNGQCVCGDGSACVQCSADKKSAVLPSCNGCFSQLNGVSYACCNDMTFNNGQCVCGSAGTPCTQCAPSPKDKEKVFPISLPTCGGCYSGVNGIDYTCSDCNISINNGQCVCGDGSACVQCLPKPYLSPFGVGPCGGLLTPNGPAVIAQAGLCVPAGSVVVQLSFYDVGSGTLIPANITIPANSPSSTYLAMQAQWGGYFGWRNVQVCLCVDPNCNGGQQLCSPAYGHGQNWEWTQWGTINIPHESIAVQNLLFGFFG